MSLKKAGSMRRLLITALTVSLALTACSEDEPEATEDDIARIEQSLIRGSELSWELLQAESRVASLCMQDEGFTVHDPIRLFGNGIPHRFVGFDSEYTRIPTVEQAELFGFGMFTRFTDTDAAVEMRENPDYLVYMAEEDGWWNPQWDLDHEEFVAMGEEYEADWMEAFLGPEGFALWQEEQAMSSEEFMEADHLEQAPPGGCELKTIEVVYGGIQEDEAEDTEDPMAYEFAMALDFAECAESAGLRDGIEEAWARKFVDPLLERETELYAWEEGIEEYLANAQEYLAG